MEKKTLTYKRKDNKCYIHNLAQAFPNVLNDG